MAEGVRQAVSRDEIIDAAARVFLREGYRGATMDQVATEVKLHKASLYHHIASKESLLTALCDAAIGASQTSLQAIIDDGELSPCEKLSAAIRQHVLILTERPGPVAAFTLYAHQIREVKLRRRYLKSRADYFTMLRGIIKETLAAHSKSDDPDLVCYSILGQCNWMQLWYRPGGNIDATKIAEEFAALSLRIVGCSEDCAA